VEYGADNKNQAPASSQRVDYREILNEQEYALFDKLRQLRKEVAEKQGIPVYAIFTNDHLASMIKNKIAGLNGIAALPMDDFVLWGTARHELRCTLEHINASNCTVANRNNNNPNNRNNNIGFRVVCPGN
jgi:superfamily II DNA helicase RecQ